MQKQERKNIMEQFIKLFGKITVADIVLLVCAVVFLAGIFRTVKKYFKNRVLEDAQKDEEWKKVIAQVNQYPQWHDQSIQIRDGLAQSIGSLETKLDEIQDDNNRRYATTCRYRIIRFNDEILKKELHTKEHFDQVLTDIDEYEDYCERVPEYKNNKAGLAIKNIKQTYQKCLLDGDFL